MFCLNVWLSGITTNSILPKQSLKQQWETQSILAVTAGRAERKCIFFWFLNYKCAALFARKLLYKQINWMNPENVLCVWMYCRFHLYTCSTASLSTLRIQSYSRPHMRHVTRHMKAIKPFSPAKKNMLVDAKPSKYLQKCHVCLTFQLMEAAL